MTSRAIEKAEATFKAAAKAGDFETADRVMEKSPEAQLGKLVNKSGSAISKLNKQAMATVNNPDELEMIDGYRTDIMRQVNQVADIVDMPRKETTLGSAFKKAAGLDDAVR